MFENLSSLCTVSERDHAITDAIDRSLCFLEQAEHFFGQDKPSVSIPVSFPISVHCREEYVLLLDVCVEIIGSKRMFGDTSHGVAGVAGRRR